MALSLKKLAGLTGEVGHCNCNAAGNCLNMSMCAFTTGVDAFTVLAWNPLAQASTSLLRLPVSGLAWEVTALRGGPDDARSDAAVPHQVTAMDARTLSLPLLYLNHFGLSKAQDTEAKCQLANNATHIISFQAPLPPVGFASFHVRKVLRPSPTTTEITASAEEGARQTVSNGVYNVTYNQAAGAIESVTNIASGVTAALNLSWGYYVSSEGGATKLPNGKEEISLQSSGAYIFRPKYQETFRTAWKQPKLTVVAGPLVTELRQEFSEYATHVIRLIKGSSFIEVEV